MLTRKTPQRARNCWQLAIAAIALLIPASLPAQTVTPTAVTMGSDGGAWALTLTATGAWTATANASFLHIVGNAGGTGNATVLFSTDPFSGTTARSGTLTIAGQTVTVTQLPKYGTGKPVTLPPPLTGNIVSGTTLSSDAAGNIYFAASNGVQRWSKGANATGNFVTAASLGVPNLVVGAFGVNPAGTAAYLFNSASGYYLGYNALANGPNNRLLVGYGSADGRAFSVVSPSPIYDIVYAAFPNEGFIGYANSNNPDPPSAGFGTVLLASRPMAALPAVRNFPWVVADTGSVQVKTYATPSAGPVVIMQGVAATALGRDTAGNIYAATSSGVFKWNAATQQTTQILSTGGTGIVADAAGDVYLATNAGIQKFNTGAPWASLGASYLTVGSAGGSNSVAINFPPSTLASWTASTTASWLHIGNAAGKGAANILFTVDANSSAAPRSATIAMDSGIELVVTQAGNNYTGVKALTTLLPSMPAYGLAADYTGNLYLANHGVSVIDKWDATTQQLTSAFVQTGSHVPGSVALDGSGNLYFSDTSLNTLQEWNLSMQKSSTLASGLNQPQGVAVDFLGNVYFADQNNDFIKAWDPLTGSTAAVTQGGTLNLPYGVAADGSGNVYFADRLNNAIKKYNRSAKAITQTVVSTGLNSPYGVSVDGYGNLYIADQDSAIKKWTAATSTVTTIGPAQVGYGTAVDGAGNVYSTAGGNSVIKLTWAFVSAATSEPGSGGTDSLIVLPAATPLSGLFAPTSDQPWLTITSAANGTIGFSFTPNETGVARTGHITVLGQSIAVTQAAGPEMLVNAGTSPQSALVGTAFTSPLAVTVKTAAGVVTSGVNVTFTAPASGASGKFSNATATITVPTNAAGVAAAPFTANATAGGPYLVSATAAGYPSATFSLTNTVAMSANPGTTPQSAVVNIAFANALAVTVLNVTGKPVAGVNVTFTAPGPGASGKFSNGTAASTVPTNASGIASAPFTANGTAGSYSVGAAAAGYPGVTFSLTNTHGPASSMAANPGTTPQSAAVETLFAIAPAVTVKDAQGNPAPGVNVTFTVPASGATGIFNDGLAAVTVATNVSGVASAPLTAGLVLGTFTASASVPGLTTVNFSLKVTPGVPVTITVNGGTPQSAKVNTTFALPLSVTVRDAGGNPVPGVNVTFGTPGLLNGVVTGVSVPTNASGVSSIGATAGPVPLSYAVVATVTGLPAVIFSLTATP